MHVTFRVLMYDNLDSRILLIRTLVIRIANYPAIRVNMFIL